MPLPYNKPHTSRNLQILLRDKFLSKQGDVNMFNKILSKRTIGVILLLSIALLSIFVLSKMASSPGFYLKTLNTLDEKKSTVMQLTAATAATSTILSAIPGDATTPIANQIAELSSYLLIVIGSIFLEKILLTLTGYISFSFIIPIACVLYGIFLFTGRKSLQAVAIKLGIFAIAIVMVIPVSVKLGDLIDNTYQTQINQTIEQALDGADSNVENNNEHSSNADLAKSDNLLDKIKDSISNVGDAVSEGLQKGEKKLNEFIDAIAVMLITSCVIPIAVLLFILWITKIIFGMNISVASMKKTKNIKQRENNDFIHSLDSTSKTELEEMIKK